MSNLNKLLEIDLDNLEKVDEDLKPILSEYLEKYVEALRPYEGNSHVEYHVMRMADYISSGDIDIKRMKKSENDYFTKNPYVTGYFSHRSRNIVIREREDIKDKEKRELSEKQTLFHELVHFSNGFDIEAYRNVPKYKWLDEALTEKISASLMEVPARSYVSYRNTLDRYLNETYEYVDEKTEILRRCHLTSNAAEIYDIIPEETQTNFAAMQSIIQDLDVNENINVRKDKLKDMQRVITEESSKKHLDMKSKYMKDFLGIYNYKKRKSEYENCIKYEDNISNENKERLVRRQILMDFTNKFSKKGNVSSDIIIKKLLKAVDSGKINKEDFSSPEAKVDILMEVQRIKSTDRIDKNKETEEISKLDVISGINTDESKIEYIKDKHLLTIDTKIKASTPYTLGAMTGSFYISTGVYKGEVENAYICNHSEFHSDGTYVDIPQEGAERFIKNSFDTDYDKRQYVNKMAEKVESLKQYKDKVAKAKLEAISEIDHKLDNCFKEYIGKDLNQVMGKTKNKNILPPSNIDNKINSNEDYITEEKILQNPRLYCRKIVEEFVQYDFTDPQKTDPLPVITDEIINDNESKKVANYER